MHMLNDLLRDIDEPKLTKHTQERRQLVDVEFPGVAVCDLRQRCDVREPVQCKELRDEILVEFVLERIETALPGKMPEIALRGRERPRASAPLTEREKLRQHGAHDERAASRDRLVRIDDFLPGSADDLDIPPRDRVRPYPAPSRNLARSRWLGA